MGVGVWLGAMSVPVPAAPLRIDPSALRFGRQWAQSRFVWSVPIYNSSAVPVEVKDVLTTCSCVELTPKSFMVPANGFTQVSFTLDLIANAGWETEATPFQNEFTLVLNTDSGEVSQRYQLQGEVRFPVRVTAAQRRLPPVLPQSALWSIPVTSELSLKAIRVKSLKAGATAFVRAESAESRRWYLDLAINANDRGPFEIPVELQPEAADGVTFLPKIRWTFQGTFLPVVQSVPDDVDFQIVARGTPVRQNIVLRRSDGKACQVREFLLPSGITARRLDSNASDAVTIEIEATFRTEGLQQTSLQVVLEESETDLETVNIPVRAYVRADERKSPETIIRRRSGSPTLPEGDVSQDVPK